MKCKTGDTLKKMALRYKPGPFRKFLLWYIRRHTKQCRACQESQARVYEVVMGWEELE